VDRKTTILAIAAIAFVAVCVGIFAAWSMKGQHASSAHIPLDQAQEKQKPFRSAVVELTFSSRSVHEGADSSAPLDAGLSTLT
jgi:hypothetical protein